MFVLFDLLELVWIFQVGRRGVQVLVSDGHRRHLERDIIFDHLKTIFKLDWGAEALSKNVVIIYDQYDNSQQFNGGILIFGNT